MTIDELNAIFARDGYDQYLDSLNPTHKEGSIMVTTLRATKENTQTSFYYAPGHEGDDSHMLCSIETVCLMVGNMRVEAYCIKRYDSGTCYKAILGYSINFIASPVVELLNSKMPSRYSIKNALRLAEARINSFWKETQKASA